MIILMLLLLACSSDASKHDSDTSADDERDASQMCARWNADRSDLNPGAWTGDADTCDPGTWDAHERTLKLFNLYRWMAGLDSLVTDDEADAKAQGCAMLMDANDTIAHETDETWACWDENRAEAAQNSLVARMGGVASIDAYMVDPGNEASLAHRRRILATSLDSFGIGSTDGYSCLYATVGTSDSGPPWVAFPPPGPFPLDGLDPLAWAYGYETTGWSVQSDTLTVSDSGVEVTVNGTIHTTTVTNLTPASGSADAISFTIGDWNPANGDVVDIVLTTPDNDHIAYQVSIVDCVE